MRRISFIVFVIFCLINFYHCQKCNVVNQYFGADYDLHNNHDRLTSNQGQPGNPGKRGAKGEKGEKGDVADVSEKIEMLSAEIRTAKDHMKVDSVELSDNVLVLKNIVSDLKENNTRLENQVTHVKSEYMRLKINNTELQKRIDNIEQVNVNLTKRVFEVENRFEENLLRLEAYINNKSYILKHQVYRTCSDAMDKTSYPVSGKFLLFGAEEKPVSVYCEVSGEKVIAKIGHDSEEEMHVDGFEDVFTYRRNVTYTTSIDDIRAIIKAHSHCRQFIKYRCIGSALLHKKWGPFAKWTSYNGEDHQYWGGSNKELHCACGITGTCVDPEHKCNCDSNVDGVEESDEGFIEEKDHLPVTALYFGDTGVRNEINEEGWHTLGPLECY